MQAFATQKPEKIPRESGGEIWVGDESPDCDGDSDDWIAVTDPNLVNITTFVVDGSGSFENSLTGSTGTITQRTRRIQMQIEGRLNLDNSITRRIEDTIKVRNDIHTLTPST